MQLVCSILALSAGGSAAGAPLMWMSTLPRLPTTSWSFILVLPQNGSVERLSSAISGALPFSLTEPLTSPLPPVATATAGAAPVGAAAGAAAGAALTAGAGCVTGAAGVGAVSVFLSSQPAASTTTAMMDRVCRSMASLSLVDGAPTRLE